jgi:glycosyltransferase 2 family protein
VVRRLSDVVALAVAVLVAAASTLALGRVDRIPPAEVAVFQAVNGLPGWVTVVVVPVMQLGVFWAPAVVALVLVALKRRMAGVAVLTAGVGAYVVARLWKMAIGRARPGELLDVIVVRDSADGLGFPSGHAAVATAIVVALVPYLAWRWRWTLIAVPVIVAFARVYVGAHLPLDVVAGAAIGVATASLTHLAFGVPPRRGGDPVDRQVRRPRERRRPANAPRANGCSGPPSASSARASGAVRPARPAG